MIADAFKERDDRSRLPEARAPLLPGREGGRLDDPLLRDRLTQVELDQLCARPARCRARATA